MEEKSYTIDEVVEYCQTVESKLKAYSSIVDERETIELNYKMMQLYAPSISVQGKRKLRHALENAPMEFNKTGIRAMMIQDGFGEWNWSSLFQHLNKIVADG